ncbi:MAG TPA: diguanylate cyclase [Acidimicrobiales bacterium]|nr:diguanylate cyclase [Acidimicrobiales bacterium]
MGKRSLNIRRRFALILVLLIPALVAVAWAGFDGLQAQRASVRSLYDNQLNSESASDLGIRLGDAHAATLELLLDNPHPAAAALVLAEFSTGITSDVDAGIATVRVNSAGSRSELASMAVIENGWTTLQKLRANGGLAGDSPAAVASEVARVEAIFDPMTAAAKSIVHVEASEAGASYQEALASYQSSLQLMLLVLVLGLVTAGGMVMWLVRSVLTRTLAYSAFATTVTEGDFTQRLMPRGSDELDQLGITLDELAQRRRSDDDYERAKIEFNDAMPLTENEQEAHDLLKRYLERAVPACTVTVLNRNNSADRLEAVTAISEDSPLPCSLEGAEPRSCLAVRLARPHTGVLGADPLLSCTVCSTSSAQTMCTPLLVGGEVIGSVLVEHEADLAGNGARSIREAVLQSAPILGNLRTLAIAEVRAATDSLTGLPNRRALDDTLKRMVAQASRALTPLAALMCDLDHFKEINDRFGHGRGDDVLAAVGAALSHSLRAGDFAGRYGGEEFLILLPATGLEGAKEAAVRLRASISAIRVPVVDRRISLSVGIAVLPEHALDGQSLERAADRALYAAKRAGRDRAEIFSAPDAAEPRVASNMTNGAPESDALPVI